MLSYFYKVKTIRFILKYLKYYFKGFNKHHIHSPFVFELLTNVIGDTTPFYIYSPIEMLRSELMNSKETIQSGDYGTGSIKDGVIEKKISDIARHSAKTAKYGQLLFRLVNHFQPQILLELGTSLGISALYQASPNKKANFITIEGCKETARIAKQNFKKINLENIQLVVGNFDTELPLVLKGLDRLDYVFFDGNHRKVPTLNYFEQCLPLVHDKTLFVFDDIHWSSEMEEAWEFIKNHPRVMVTIDLFFVGLVFFRKEQTKEHFIIRF